MYAAMRESLKFHCGVTAKRWHVLKFSDEDRPSRKKRKGKHKTESNRLSRRAEMEEVEDVFQKLKEKHKDYSGLQLRLWARMITSKTHDDLDNPPKVPIINRCC